MTGALEQPDRPRYAPYSPTEPIGQPNYFTVVRAGNLGVGNDNCGVKRQIVWDDQKLYLNELCEVWVGAGQPKDKHRRHWVKYSCHSLGCSTCYESACSRGAKRIKNRLEGMREAYQEDGVFRGSQGRWRHISFSVAPESWPRGRLEEDGGKAFRAECLELIREYSRGHYAGILILHPWRKKHIDGSDCDLKGCTKEHKWIWGPHIHFLGMIFLERSDIVHRKTGWVYVAIKDRSLKRSVYSTARYLLTHCGLVITTVSKDHTYEVEMSGREDRWDEDGRQHTSFDWHKEDREYHTETTRRSKPAYVYIGEVSPSKGRPETLEHEEPSKCPVCRGAIRRYLVDGKGTAVQVGWFDNTEVMERTTEIIRYVLLPEKGPPNPGGRGDVFGRTE